jgi:hypothetical protein
MSERERAFERGKPFTPSKLKLKNYADGLALLEGGDTPDIVRQGSLELWPGCVLVATVLDPDSKYNPDIAQLISEGWVPVAEDYEPIYSLTIYDDEGYERESLSIDAWTGIVDATMEESDLFEPGQDAPDYMIESFFRRYYLDHGPMSLAD